jgi:hypothetical protein
MTQRFRAFVIILAAPLVLALPASVGAGTRADPVLIASVGSAGAPDSFHISLTDANGKSITRIPAGEYTIQVHDYATIHDFHLSGPGVDEATEISTVTSPTWTVTFVNGTYKYVCDFHPTILHGVFAVGPPPPPPTAPVLLTAKVVAGGVVSLRKAGVAVKTLPLGRYRIRVADTSAKENFHLTGPGVNAKTGLAFKGSKTLAVTLKKGAYRYRSDAHPKRGRALPVTAG